MALKKIFLLAFVVNVSIFNMSAKVKPEAGSAHIVFLISEDTLNYEAHKTIPELAEMLRVKHRYKVTVLLGKGAHTSFRFPNIETIRDANLIVVFCRRIALPHDQMNTIKEYLKAGKPLIGIRTANHAFSVLSGTISDGYEDWKEFVPEILGCLNRGYGPVKPGTDVKVSEENSSHPILDGTKAKAWHSIGNVYQVAPLVDEKAVILLYGTAGDKTEPVAWARTVNNQRIFYTSLGYPDDFNNPSFLKLLINGISWTLEK